MTKNAAPPSPPRGFVRGLALGALLPPLAMGAGAAILFASIRPPLVWLTGLGRWEVQPPFAAAGMMLSLWLIAAPGVAALYALARARGPETLRRWPPLAAAASALLTAAALTLAVAWFTTGGPGRPEFGDELFNWGLIWAGACAGVALCLEIGVRLSAGLARRPNAKEETA